MPAEGRTTSTNECRGSGRRVSGRATSGRLDRSKIRNQGERARSSGRSTGKRGLRRPCGGSAGKRLFGRGVQAGCRGFEDDRGGCLAACSSLPHAQRRNYDETTHLKPRHAANCIAASIVNRAAAWHQPVLDRVSADCRTFRSRRRVQLELRSTVSLDGSEWARGARLRRPKALQRFTTGCKKIDVEKKSPIFIIKLDSLLRWPCNFLDFGLRPTLRAR